MDVLELLGIARRGKGEAVSEARITGTTNQYRARLAVGSFRSWPQVVAAGQVLTATVFATGPVLLAVYDREGREVASSEGIGEAGLEFKPVAGGRFYLLVAADRGETQCNVTASILKMLDDSTPELSVIGHTNGNIEAQ